MEQSFDRSSLLWAKTSRRDDSSGAVSQWRPLLVHLRDTAEVARLLARQKLSRQQRAAIQRDLGSGIELEDLAWLLGGLHDAGKAGPIFQSQAEDLSQALFRRTSAIADEATMALNTRAADVVSNQAEFPHSLASEIIVARVLAEDFGLQGKVTSLRPLSTFGQSAQRARPLPIVHQLASVVGAHHGMTAPTDTPVQYIFPERWPLRLGSRKSPWHDVQRHVVLTLIGESGIDFASAAWRDPSLHLDTSTLSLLTGLVIQADWIASNQDLFPLIGIDEDITACDSSAAQAASAWKQLALPTPWVAVPEKSVDAALSSRFNVLASARARPGQRLAHAETWALNEPALVIMEDETGAGKTEAALLAAENLAAATGASGLFIGLPTQATANGVFTRARAWLECLPTAGGPVAATSLAHSKASLNPAFRGLRRLLTENSGGHADEPAAIVSLRVEGGLPGDAHIDDESGSARQPGGGSQRRILSPGVHSWLAGRKKRLLADFVIGTVDQVLMGSLKARHLMLRHSGLADKVVIIDEAHAADATMQVFMRAALVWLGRWGAPTIILTATLPPGQRDALIEAYRSGLALRHGTDDVPRGLAATNAENPLVRAEPHDPDEAPYPVLTVATHAQTRSIPFEGMPSRTYALQELSDDDAALVRTLKELSGDGGCIAVIRNSVARVQSTAALLRSHFGEEIVTVVHARFAASDRAALDRWLVETFGKGSSSRPKFAIVVASQVVEQSLDIDFDAMVTDMCPIDLLIQRLGRLHRHPGRDRPELLASPTCYLTGVETWSTDPPAVGRHAAAIYGLHLLLRSIATLREVCGRNGALVTPTHVAPLVHRVYSDRPVAPESWQPTLDQAATDHRKHIREAQELADRWTTTPQAAEFGLDGWLNENDGDGEDTDPYLRERGRVRDSADSIEVLLVLTDGTGWRTLDWLPRSGGVSIPEVGDVSWAVAEAVANSSVRLPFDMARGYAGDAVIGELEKWGRASLQRSPLLRGQLILPLAARDSSGTSFTAHVGDWSLTYDRRDGLSASHHGTSSMPGGRGSAAPRLESPGKEVDFRDN